MDVFESLKACPVVMNDQKFIPKTVETGNCEDRLLMDELEFNKKGNLPPKEASSTSEVYNLIYRCLIKIIPSDLWGSRDNFLHFMESIKLLLTLGRYVL